MKKTIKKITCAALAAVSVFGCAATMSGCETSHPEVEMEIAFNGKTYTLEYKLYRKTAPSTVSHFLWLAGNGYYDGLCVHNYDDSNSRLYTGSYTATDGTDLVYKKYYDVVKTYANANEFPHSVWLDAAKTQPTYSLRGEFSANNVEVKSGALKESFGSLSMYYNSISNETIAQTDVYTVRADGDEVGKADYQENSATSTFFISLSSSNKTNNEYCTFATLDEDSEDILKELQTAINDYVESQDGLTQEVEVKENVFGGISEEYAVSKTYNVPKSSIVINKVTVNKY